jgi:hypothetical protein
MTDLAFLERRYRRLLKLYPRAFRAEHEQEILSVLMACAAEGQRWPGRADAANLIRSALWMRLRRGSDWEYTHRPRVWLMVRLFSGTWLTILTVVLCGYGRWWGLALVPAVAIHFYRAHRLGLAIQAGEDGDPPPTQLTG